MNSLTSAQKRALHRVIEMAETWVRAASSSNAPRVEAWEDTIRDAKSAMQQVHIQQVYLKMQNDIANGVKLVPVASGSQHGK